MKLFVTAVAVVVVLLSCCSRPGASNVILDLVKAKLPAPPPSPPTEKVVPRILGGQRIGDRCQAPFNAMVALKIQTVDTTSSRAYCSAVMITSEWLVTAALCVFPFVTFARTDLSVVLGDKVLNAPDQNEQTIAVANFYIHQRFNASTGDNDIALIRLQQAAALSSCVQPLPLYEQSACYSAISDCLITGWGPWDGKDVHDCKGDFPEELPSAQVYFGRDGMKQRFERIIQEGAAANNIYSNSLWPNSGEVKVLDEVVTRMTVPAIFDKPVPEGSLFAIPSNNYVQACVFDWGGLTACSVNGQWRLRGVIAQDNCFSQSQPIVITNIAPYRAWINTCIANANYCQSL